MSISEDEIPASQSSQSSRARKSAPLPRTVKDSLEYCIKFMQRCKTPEDEQLIETCFYCKNGGDLILCDDAHCNRGWHVRCAGLKKAPESFRCPWHTCSLCSQSAIVQCVQCPTSFCTEHLPMRAFRKFQKAKQYILCPDCTSAMYSSSSASKCPPPYHHISDSMASVFSGYLCGNIDVGMGKMKVSAKDLEEHVCMCVKDCGDKCINRLMNMECVPSFCPCGESCTNQRIGKSRGADVYPFNTESPRGWGLKCTHDLVPGQFVIEYQGEIITGDRCEQRMNQYRLEGENHFYMFCVSSDHVIDAYRHGNYARFANHSCAPNMVAQKWWVNGVTRVGLFASKFIPAETELTYDYQIVVVGDAPQTCLCGAPDCQGEIIGKDKASSKKLSSPPTSPARKVPASPARTKAVLPSADVSAVASKFAAVAGIVTAAPGNTEAKGVSKSTTSSSVSRGRAQVAKAATTVPESGLRRGRSRGSGSDDDERKRHQPAMPVDSPVAKKTKKTQAKTEAQPAPKTAEEQKTPTKDSNPAVTPSRKRKVEVSASVETPRSTRSGKSSEVTSPVTPKPPVSQKAKTGPRSRSKQPKNESKGSPAEKTMSIIEHTPAVDPQSVVDASPEVPDLLTTSEVLTDDLLQLNPRSSPVPSPVPSPLPDVDETTEVAAEMLHIEETTAVEDVMEGVVQSVVEEASVRFPDLPLVLATSEPIIAHLTTKNDSSVTTVSGLIDTAPAPDPRFPPLPVPEPYTKLKMQRLMKQLEAEQFDAEVFGFSLVDQVLFARTHDVGPAPMPHRPYSPPQGPVRVKYPPTKTFRADPYTFVQRAESPLPEIVDSPVITERRALHTRNSGLKNIVSADLSLPESLTASIQKARIQTPVSTTLSKNSDEIEFTFEPSVPARASVPKPVQMRVNRDIPKVRAPRRDRPRKPRNKRRNSDSEEFSEVEDELEELLEDTDKITGGRRAAMRTKKSGLSFYDYADSSDEEKVVRKLIGDSAPRGDPMFDLPYFQDAEMGEVVVDVVGIDETAPADERRESLISLFPMQTSPVDPTTPVPFPVGSETSRASTLQVQSSSQRVESVPKQKMLPNVFELQSVSLSPSPSMAGVPSPAILEPMPPMQSGPIESSHSIPSTPSMMPHLVIVPPPAPLQTVQAPLPMMMPPLIAQPPQIIQPSMMPMLSLQNQGGGNMVYAPPVYQGTYSMGNSSVSIQAMPQAGVPTLQSYSVPMSPSPQMMHPMSALPVPHHSHVPSAPLNNPPPEANTAQPESFSACYSCVNSQNIADEDVVTCSVPQCGHRYHRECLDDDVDTNKPFECDRHRCSICVRERSVSACVRCIRGYCLLHLKESGSFSISARNIVCEPCANFIIRKQLPARAGPTAPACFCLESNTRNLETCEGCAKKFCRQHIPLYSGHKSGHVLLCGSCIDKYGPLTLWRTQK